MIKNNRLFLSAVAFSMAGHFALHRVRKNSPLGVLWALLIRQGILLQ